MRVRQAVTHALDRDSYIAALAEGDGVWTGTYPYHRFPDFALPMDELKEFLKFDLAQSTKLMAAAGFEDGFDANIAWFPPQEGRSTSTSRCLKKIGINLDTGAETLDYPGWVSKTFSGQFSQFAAWGYLVGSIWDYVFGLHHTNGNRNGPQQSIPEIDAKIDKMIRTTDTEEQIQLVQEIERTQLTEGLWIHHCTPAKAT